MFVYFFFCTFLCEQVRACKIKTISIFNQQLIYIISTQHEINFDAFQPMIWKF